MNAVHQCNGFCPAIIPSYNILYTRIHKNTGNVSLLLILVKEVDVFFVVVRLSISYVLTLLDEL